MKFRNVVFTNVELFKNTTVKYCPKLYFVDEQWVDAVGTRASDDSIAASAI